MLKIIGAALERAYAPYINSWRHARSGTYISLYQSEFDMIALGLSKPGKPVWTYVTFDPPCVEFRSYNGTIASIKMHGEAGSVYRTIVEGSLSTPHRLFFTALLPGKVVFTADTEEVTH